MPHKIPPAPPFCPVPGAPWVPSPISGRPTNVWVGALITPSTCCSVFNSTPLPTSTTAYSCPALVNVCANCTWKAVTWTLSV
ncbi:Uncharacterised protein [Mycobacterium tuberculosis]|uniref:Uncharacterized protein n=1 Tax=Mycobacterium tuberculosis TaxID=1773 RepID=A0A0U0SMC2_MYCTX|nr:Uncharacterised protein [Mycobacterium tuberculosis]COX31379.1 Uncharacterised protein [Mycobacterium tuberculosis]